MRIVPLRVVALAGFVLGCAVLVVAVTAHADTHVIAPSDVQVVVVPAANKVVAKATTNLDAVEDCGDSDGASDQWSYICELGDYQAWFAFDVSGLIPGSLITSMRFSAYMDNDTPAPVERSLWYDADDSWVGDGCPDDSPGDVLVGTLTHGASASQWETFDIDLGAHDFNADIVDGMITLMVTGPTDGEHLCGTIDLTESGNVPYLTVIGPQGAGIPTIGIAGLLLLVVLLAGAGFVLLRR